MGLCRDVERYRRGCWASPCVLRYNEPEHQCRIAPAWCKWMGFMERVLVLILDRDVRRTQLDAGVHDREIEQLLLGFRRLPELTGSTCRPVKG